MVVVPLIFTGTEEQPKMMSALSFLNICVNNTLVAYGQSRHTRSRSRGLQRHTHVVLTRFEFTKLHCDLPERKLELDPVWYPSVFFI